jgi:DNA-binding GntR family transcriptional regulator
MGRLSIAFNAAIVDAAGSTRIKVVLRSMTPLVPGEFFDLVPRAMEIERSGSTAVLAAIEARHPDDVTAAFAEMMQRLGEAVSAVFATRGLLENPDAGGTSRV